MNLIKAFRDVFSDDPAYHARRDAEKALALVEHAREVVGDLDAPVTVTCSTQYGHMNIDSLVFFQALPEYADRRQREALDVRRDPA